ncbi:MAG: NodT family efflux transporter outer membrane factor (OMF) lipoprotein [Verrucomicrobiales bacterium]|jgi:NodT family efflux transporter outer membrane factor (OMF) lipoprotein
MTLPPKPNHCLLLIGLLAVFVFSGCHSVTEGKRLRNQASRIAPRAWKAEQVRGEVSNAWLALFRDRQLVQLVEEAQRNNLDLRVTAANVDRLRALVRQTGATLYPNIRFTGAGERTKTGREPSSSGMESSFVSEWEIDVWGRLRAERSSAIEELHASEFDFRYAQHAIAAAVAKAYFLSIDADLQHVIAKDSEANLQKIYDYVKRQEREGFANPQDVEVILSDLSQSKADVVSSANAIRDSLRSLEFMLGRYPSATTDVPDKFPKLPSRPKAGLPSQLLERRPDVRAAERRVAASFDQLHMAKAARLPRFSLTSSIGGASSHIRDLTSPENLIRNLGANMFAPIFEGGAIQSQIDVAEAEQRIALSEYAKTALTAFREVESNLDLGGSLAQQYVHLTESRNSSNKAYRIAETRYANEDISLLDLLEIQQRTFERRSVSLATERSQLEQRIDLYLALGGDWR